MDVINTSFLWLCFDNLGRSTISFIMLLQNFGGNLAARRRLWRNQIIQRSWYILYKS